MLEFTIPGTPIAWAAPTYGKYGMFSRRTDHKKGISFILRSQYKGDQLEGALKLICVFYMPIPLSISLTKKEALSKENVPHITKPDLTNLIKHCEDAIELSGIVSNDSTIFCIEGVKLYSKVPRTLIRIEEMEENVPLIKSSSKKAVSENIRREKAAGKKQDQAVAIALDVQRRAKRGKK